MQWLTHIINFRKKFKISIRCVLSAISRPIGLPCLLHYPYPSEILMSRARRGRSTICLQRVQDDCPKGSQGSHSILSVERPGGIRYVLVRSGTLTSCCKQLLLFLALEMGLRDTLFPSFPCHLRSNKAQFRVPGSRLPAGCELMESCLVGVDVMGHMG